MQIFFYGFTRVYFLWVLGIAVVDGKDGIHNGVVQAKLVVVRLLRGRRRGAFGRRGWCGGGGRRHGRRHDGNNNFKSNSARGDGRRCCRAVICSGGCGAGAGIRVAMERRYICFGVWFIIAVVMRFGWCRPGMAVVGWYERFIIFNVL